MNFQNIPPVDRSDELLDLVFRKAREKVKLKTVQRDDRLAGIRKRELARLDIVKAQLSDRLKKILSAFPGTSVLPEFYVDLIRLTLDFVLFKQSLGAISWVVTRIFELHKLYCKRISKAASEEKIKQFVKEFYGRLASVIKQIDQNLQYLEKARRIMRTYPDVKEMYTICIYGFPNVGKTTLLNKLTGSKAETAAYAFTTKSINAGYLTIKDITVQLLDVPGTLARKDKQNLIELQAELVLDKLADLVLYVFDLSGYSGYSIEQQEKLLQKIKHRKPILIYLSKQDLTKPEVLQQFPHEHYSFSKIKQAIAIRVADSS